MAAQYSGAVRNAMLDAWETAIGVSAKLQIFTGSKPANCAAASSGTKLVEIALASDWSANASGGSKSMSSTPLAFTGVGDGNAGYYRIVDSAGTTCHEQGSVTATGGGGDLTLDNVSIATGQSGSITSFSKTAPGA